MLRIGLEGAAETRTTGTAGLGWSRLAEVGSNRSFVAKQTKKGAERQNWSLNLCCGVVSGVDVEEKSHVGVALIFEESRARQETLMAHRRHRGAWSIPMEKRALTCAGKSLAETAKEHDKAEGTWRWWQDAHPEHCAGGDSEQQRQRTRRRGKQETLQRMTISAPRTNGKAANAARRSCSGCVEADH